MEANKDSKGEPLRTKRKRGHVKTVTVCHVLTPDAGERLSRAIDILLRPVAALPRVNGKKEEMPQGEKSDDGTTKTN